MSSLSLSLWRVTFIFILHRFKTNYFQKLLVVVLLNTLWLKEVVSNGGRGWIWFFIFPEIFSRCFEYWSIFFLLSIGIQFKNWNGLASCNSYFSSPSKAACWPCRTNWPWKVLSSVHRASIPWWDAPYSCARNPTHKSCNYSPPAKNNGNQWSATLWLHGCATSWKFDHGIGTAAFIDCIRWWGIVNTAWTAYGWVSIGAQFVQDANHVSSSAVLRWNPHGCLHVIHSERFLQVASFAHFTFEFSNYSIPLKDSSLNFWSQVQFSYFGFRASLVKF